METVMLYIVLMIFVQTPTEEDSRSTFAISNAVDTPEECEEIALKTQQLPEGVKVPGFDNLIGVACLHLPAPAKYFEAEDQK